MNAPYVELSFQPSVGLVSVVRRFVGDFYRRYLDDADGTSRVALATHELLENALKYSKDGDTTIRIEVELTQPRQVRITLQNRADAEHLGEIREIVEGVRQAADPDVFYQALLLRKAKTRDGSGLGLARICAEGEMQVTCTVDEADLVTIEATTWVGAPASA